MNGSALSRKVTVVVVLLLNFLSLSAIGSLVALILYLKADSSTQPWIKMKNSFTEGGVIVYAAEKDLTRGLFRQSQSDVSDVSGKRTNRLVTDRTWLGAIRHQETELTSYLDPSLVDTRSSTWFVSYWFLLLCPLLVVLSSVAIPFSRRICGDALLNLRRFIVPRSIKIPRGFEVKKT